MFFSKSTRFIYFIFKNSPILLSRKVSDLLKPIYITNLRKLTLIFPLEVPIPYLLYVALSLLSLVIIISCSSTLFTFLPVEIV